MPARVATRDLISINAQQYKRVGPVRWFNIDQPPGKLSLGEHTDETNPLASTWTITDLRDGIGVNVMDVARDQGRAWWATVQLRHRGHIVLPRLATLTAAISTLADIGVLAAFKNEVYATSGTAVHVYNNASDAWGSSVRTLLGNATDWASGLVGGTDTLVIATGNEVDYATDSATWNRNTTDIKYVTFWSDLLWGIDQSGQLYYTDDLSNAWTSDAKLQLADDSVRALVVARGPDREQHIYAGTNRGWFVHDADNARFLPTDLSELPVHPDAGKGAEKWRGALYLSVGNAVILFQAGSDQTVVDSVGPDRDDGLPSDRRGSIIQLLQSHNELIAVLDATTGVGISNVGTRSSAGLGSSRASTFGAAAGLGQILGWDGRGWEVKWAGGTSGRAITAAVVTNAYSTYRLWWAQNQRVYFMQLPVDVTNPKQVTTLDYAASGTLETPWFDGGVSNQNKLALSLFVDSTHPSTGETLKFEYATDLVESYTTIATKTATGQTEYTLPSSSDVTGVAFRYIKFRVTFTRGSTTTSTPDLHKMYLVWRKRVPSLYGVRVLLDLSETVNDVPPNQQVKNLLTANHSDPLIEVTWRDDSATNDPQNYYMDILNIQFEDESGEMSIPPQHVLVELGEPRQSVSR